MQPFASPPARILALLLALAVGLAAPTAAATVVRSRVSIHISPGGSAAYFYGVVRSDRAACVGSRSVTVQVSPTGTDGWLDDVTVGTNSDGTWSAWYDSGGIGNGYYRVVVARKVTGSVDCRRAVSAVFFAD